MSLLGGRTLTVPGSRAAISQALSAPLLHCPPALQEPRAETSFSKLLLLVIAPIQIDAPSRSTTTVYTPVHSSPPQNGLTILSVCLVVHIFNTPKRQKTCLMLTSLFSSRKYLLCECYPYLYRMEFVSSSIYQLLEGIAYWGIKCTPINLCDKDISLYG